MKRVLTVLLMLAVAASLFAGGAENKNNLSAGYLRTLSKNAETKKADAVFYNPAGTAYMEDGLYAEIGNQSVFKNYNHDVTTPSSGFDKYESTNPILLYPNVALVYKLDNFAIYGGFSVFGGGGTINYDDGTYLTNAILSKYKLLGATDDDIEHSLEVFSAVFGEIIGGSYAINDYVSISAGVRLLQGKQTLKADLDNEPTVAMQTGGGGLPGLSSKTVLDTEATANGYGFIFSIHTKPADKIDFAVQYQTISKMEYEYDKADGDLAALAGYSKGDKFDRDLPAILAAGIGYQLLDPLYTTLSFNYYFNEQTDNDLAEFDDSWEIGLGASYQLTDMAVASAGLLYSKQGFTDDENIIEGPVLDSLGVGAGTELTFMEDLAIDISIFKSFYFESGYETDVSGTAFEMDANKNLLILSVGATYKFF